ncbi:MULTISPECIES: hypothetical protein [Streptomyces]|uniref:Transposase n=1 Tax=Streptomyces ramulosus TaxID=47762 RepID=A0ABW1FLS3_9ACTN
MWESLVQAYEHVLPWAPLAPLVPLAVVMWWPSPGRRGAKGGGRPADPEAFRVEPIRPPRSRRPAPAEGLLLPPCLVAYERKLAASAEWQWARRRALMRAVLGM